MSIRHYLKELDHPRTTISQYHLLWDLIAITLFAMSNGSGKVALSLTPDKSGRSIDDLWQVLTTQHGKCAFAS